ncbi:MAG: efflux RND transporter permease subunit, partial [Phycisphaerales bacterium]
MDIVRAAISRPVSVAVGVILVVMFGLIGFSAVPVQLAPNVDQPKITVTTNWAGRSPEEIVDEIIKKQEEQLKNVSNLKAMKSTARQGSGEVSLDFYLGTDISRALQEVSDS